MANFGPLTGTNSSQFFLTLRDGLDFLDDNYTMFGEVVEGEEALDKMNALFVDERHRPLQDVRCGALHASLCPARADTGACRRIRATHVLYDPFPEPERMPDAPDTDASGKRPAEETVLARPSIDEPVGDEGRTEEELAEEGKAKEARNRAVVLEMVGDLPDADVKPPENVLFVCKLNPVTQDEDLELIFSRFGEIRSCEVIRDQQTGDSLQYAFIEFESQPQCEEAYLKMNNVLIDDRRIKVRQGLLRVLCAPAVLVTPLPAGRLFPVGGQAVEQVQQQVEGRGAHARGRRGGRPARAGGAHSGRRRCGTPQRPAGHPLLA